MYIINLNTEMIALYDSKEKLERYNYYIGSIIDTLIKKIDKNSFLSQLKKVKIYRIEVPKNTDLNRYFEIMNTRGEQLEQHDILKAKLMSVISNDKIKEQFAKVWDACSDMTGYVQMHFDTEMRDQLFGQNWDELLHIPLNLEKENKTNRGLLELK